MSPNRSSYIPCTVAGASGCVPLPPRNYHETTHHLVIRSKAHSGRSATGRPAQPVGLLSRYRRRLGAALPPGPYLSPGRAASAGHPHLPGTPHPHAHHLDQRRRASRLARRLLSLLAFQVGSSPTVHPHPPESPSLVSRPLHWCGHRLHAIAQNRSADSAGLLSARSALSQVPRQLDARPTVPAGLAVGAPVSPSQGWYPCPAHRV